MFKLQPQQTLKKRKHGNGIYSHRLVDVLGLAVSLPQLPTKLYNNSTSNNKAKVVWIILFSDYMIMNIMIQHFQDLPSLSKCISSTSWVYQIVKMEKGILIFPGQGAMIWLQRSSWTVVQVQDDGLSSLGKDSRQKITVDDPWASYIERRISVKLKGRIFYRRPLPRLIDFI